LTDCCRAWSMSFGSAYLAYVVSFLTIGTAWLAHTGIDRPARTVRSDLLALRDLAGRSLAAFPPR